MSIAASVSPDAIFTAMFAYQQTAALKAAIDLDLFTAIDDGAADASALAERAGASPRGVRILCDYLTTIDMLAKQGDRYSLTPNAAAFLSRKSPAYMGSVAQFLTLPELKRNFDDLTGAVKRGGVLPSGNTVATENPIWVEFARAMVPMAMANAHPIAEIVHLRGDREARVLDIAAGHGMYGIVFAQRNPRVHVTALDWAPVLAVAVEHARQAGVADRFETLAGDAFTTDLGAGYDLVLVTNFLHHFNAEQCTGFLRKVAAALKPEGQVAVVDFTPNPDRVTPPIAAGFSLTMLAGTPEGDAYTLDELSRMLEAAGFQGMQAHGLPTGQTVIVATRT
jgi:2-polyprenyl-3-methyl-5-hydroxy-6-metoxy-1,4-benzoquinol methylase